MANSIRIHQLADAITAVPGAVVKVLDAFTSTTRSYSGSTYADIDTPNLTGVTFPIAVAGDYYFVIRHQIYNSSTGADGRLKVIFDAGGYGGFTEQPFYDDTGTTLFFNCTNIRPGTSHVVGPVPLEVGTHTIGLQWKFVAGSGNLVSDASTGWNVFGEMRAGSGAGGVIKTKDTLTGDETGLTATTPTTLPNLSVTFSAVVGEEVSLKFNGTFINAVSASKSIRLDFAIDGTAITTEDVVDTASNIFGTFINMEYPFIATSTSHTLTIKYHVDSGGNFTLKDDARLWVDQYRGGQVSIKQNGTVVSATPNGYDFIGNNVDIRENADKSISIEWMANAEGVDVQQKDLSSDTVINTIQPSYQQLANLTYTGEFGNEKVLVCGRGWGNKGGVQVDIYCRITVDGSTVIPVSPGSGAGFNSGDTANTYGDPLNFAVFIPVTAGTRTIRVEWARGTSGSNWTLKQGYVMQVARFKGGYTIPDNVPVFERDVSDTSVINAVPAIGASSEMRLLLNDGIRRTATLPLTCDIDVDGIGGRDTGDATAEAAGDLYHLCAVESDVDVTKIKLVLSKDAVPGTSGPPSFAVSRYLFTVRVASISPTVIERFEMSENGDYYPYARDDTNYSIDAVTAATPGTVGSWVDKSAALRALVPESADVVHLAGFLTCAASQTIFVDVKASPSWTPDLNQPYTKRFIESVSSSSGIEVKSMAIPTRSLAIWYNTSSTTYSDIAVAGYHNALYPGSRGGVQAQAKNTLIVDTRTTGPVTLSNADDGKLWTNDGATGSLTFNLHDAPIGFTARFAVLAAQTVQVVTHSASVDIRIAGTITAGASKYTSAATIGNTLEIVRVTSALWVAKSAPNGTWTMST